MYFANHGNDVIDASASLGAVTIYGGRGDDFIRGSQADDQLAGGSGHDFIFGEGGNDHVYGDSGFNLDFDVSKDETTDNAIVARLSTVPTANKSPLLTADAVIVIELSANGSPIERTTPVILAGQDTIFGNDGADIIFGDHGVISPITTARS
jgi:Ca2+-binding RTX toxin-like protein